MTEAQFTAMSGIGGVNFIGPLSLHAAVELLYRVSKLRLQGYFVDSVDPTTIDFDVELALDGISNERERFADCSYGFGGVETYAQPFIVSTVFDPYTEDAMVELVTTNDYGVIDDFTGYDVIHVTDAVGPNKYHLNGVINWRAGPPILIVLNRASIPLDSSDEVFDASLVLASGTFPIPLIADWDGAHAPASSSMTITATEWFPFECKDGDPAWDTTTGLPINDGPSG